MKRNFHDIEDVFADAEKNSLKKERRLVAKVDRIEKRLSTKLVSRHEKDRKISAMTWSDAQRTYVS